MLSVHYLAVATLVFPSVFVNCFLCPSLRKVVDISLNTISAGGEEGNGDSDEDLFLAIQEKKKEIADNLLNFQGAGKPRPELKPEEIVPLLMTALKLNDFPEEDAGLVSMWEFASDTTRYIFKNNITGELIFGFIMSSQFALQ
jgi:hypothetical protein